MLVVFAAAFPLTLAIPFALIAFPLFFALLAVSFPFFFLLLLVFLFL